jgi:hypothetical protein
MAKTPKRKKARKAATFSLDEELTRTGRGRPGVAQSEVVGRASNYRRMFWSERLRGRKGNKKWVRDKPYAWAVALAAAKTSDEAMRALDSAPIHIQSQFKPLVALILQVLQERDFPKRQDNQFDFLAESLAGRGEISPRRSRDICGEARAIERAKSPHRILRKEFYIECSCGYKGPALNEACRKCGAAIAFSFEDLL